MPIGNNQEDQVIQTGREHSVGLHRAEADILEQDVQRCQYPPVLYRHSSPCLTTSRGVSATDVIPDGCVPC